MLFVYTGTHFGMEKTKEQVSSQYYWMGITYSVRNTIHTCLNCSSRSKTIGPTFSFNTSGSKTNTSVSAATMATKHSAMVWEGGDEAVIDGGESTDVGDLNEGVDGTSDLTAMTAPALVKQELEKQAADVFFVSKDICSYFWQKVILEEFIFLQIILMCIHVSSVPLWLLPWYMTLSVCACVCSLHSEMCKRLGPVWARCSK